MISHITFNIQRKITRPTVIFPLELVVILRTRGIMMDIFEHSPFWLLIIPALIIVVGFKFYILKPTRRMDAGLFSLWIETETINDHQKRTVKKYSFSKWCYLKVVVYETDKDYYNSL